MKIKQLFYTGVVVLASQGVFAQKASWRDTSRVSFPSLKYTLNASGSHYIKASVVSQIWARYSEMNPGTAIYGTPVGAYSDIGIRRLRFSAWGQLTDRVFFYAQFGQNSFNFLGRRYTGAFFHDAVSELKIAPQISIGGGLTGWSGLSRFASPSVASIMPIDAPLYQQTTNGITDQFLRKLAIYAKGQIGRLDYRVAVASPMSVQNSAVALPAGIAPQANFSPLPPKMQLQGYFFWQFFDKEDNTLPYTAGTYLGKKKVFNIGAGFIDQQDAMWHLNGDNDTVFSPMTLLGVDAFLDLPVGRKGAAVSAYAAFNDFDLGPDYMRSFAPMNPANDVVTPGQTLNGAGTAFPMIGTGHTVYAHVGYKLKDRLLGDGTLMPYATMQYSTFERVSDPVTVWSGGVNWFIHGTHNAKLTLDYQSRPVFLSYANGENESKGRKSMVTLQFQVAF